MSLHAFYTHGPGRQAGERPCLGRVGEDVLDALRAAARAPDGAAELPGVQDVHQLPVAVQHDHGGRRVAGAPAHRRKKPRLHCLLVPRLHLQARSKSHHSATPAACAPQAYACRWHGPRFITQSNRDSTRACLSPDCTCRPTALSSPARPHVS